MPLVALTARAENNSWRGAPSATKQILAPDRWMTRDGLVGRFRVDLELARWRVDPSNLEPGIRGRKFAGCSAERRQRGPEKIDRDVPRCGCAAKWIYEVGPRGPLECDPFKAGERDDREAVGKNKFGVGVRFPENSRCVRNLTRWSEIQGADRKRLVNNQGVV